MQVPLKTKLGYGFGSIAYGIKDNGFAVFLLFYYNQVIGLDGFLVALALATALVLDACIDPLIGQFSDNTRTRLGKRHPWLYGSAIPIAAAWLLLWHPPQMSDTMTFIYLLVTAIFVRVSLSAYEVPSLALLPELTPDYHERTTIMRYRFLFGWTSGLAIMALAYGVILRATPDYPDGQLNPEGYSVYAIIGAVMMFIAVLVSALTTHKRIISSYEATQHDEQHKGFGELMASFRYYPFMMLLLASFFAFTNQGLYFALTNYLFRHIWELSEIMFLAYSLTLILGVLLAFLTVSPVSQKYGKPRAASYFVLAGVIIGSTPYWLRLAGFFPGNESPALIPLLFGLSVIGTGLGIAAMILAMSMMADVASGYEKETGKKSEGVFSAGMFFMQKLVSGFGLILAGSIITLIGLPDGAARGSVDDAIVANLNMAFVIISTLLGLLTAWAFRKIPLSEDEHHARLAEPNPL
ncbi:MFS transporter [Sphingorhabdus sp. Alg239-R122]|uniref:MFS transporter n=1 Tax=Sphingorhabdus sp. Alg239-R122 TaxID=2305989 RepID=UPI0013DA50F9|nr:MFS transporter [Sphingorhabdus sp. Alg239-R122]